ncbi:MAG: AIPR family protein, partial [Aggregatilineales bacterium]
MIAVSLVHIHDFVSAGRFELFASNVRQYLRGTKVNRGIRETIQNSPERFWLYNNGITIVCDDFQEENFSVQVLSPQIVNGCQTAQSIWEILSKKREGDRQQIRGDVLVRIIKGANDTEKENITRYTNTQNAVRGKDFFSLDDFQKKLQRRFKSLGYFYEIQRGAFASLKPSERAKYEGIPELSYLVDVGFKRLIPALDATQAFASGFKELPVIAYSRPNEFAPPTGDWYDKVFEESLEPEPKLFLYPFLLREWAKKTGYGRGGDGSWRAYAALFFVWGYYKLVMEILKNRGYVKPLDILPEKVPMEIWDKIFYGIGKYKSGVSFGLLWGKNQVKL